MVMSTKRQSEIRFWYLASGDLQIFIIERFKVLQLGT